MGRLFVPLNPFEQSICNSLLVEIVTGPFWLLAFITQRLLVLVVRYTVGSLEQVRRKGNGPSNESPSDELRKPQQWPQPAA